MPMSGVIFGHYTPVFMQLAILRKSVYEIKLVA